MILNQLDQTGYATNLFPFNASELAKMEEYADAIRNLSIDKRKNIFSIYPDLQDQINTKLNDLQLSFKSSNYCFYIEKNFEKNWPLALHQDVNFPEYIKDENTDLDKWKQDGFWFRINLDASTQETGALKVVPASHIGGKNKANTETVFLDNQAGEVTLFKPLLYHGSNKMIQKSRRRVLQAFCIPIAS
jgi:ectoine hydroxylase-related dioxygenase (phytanoyl-CoA dioxygenase family)